MEPSTSVLADLLALAEARADSGDDLKPLLRDLGASCALAVTSWLGFSITLILDGVPTDLTFLGEPLEHREHVTSLTIPLAGLADVAAGSEITLYANKLGALVELAADLNFALGLGPHVAQFDLHLARAEPGRPSTGLDQAMVHHQALGILLDQGYDLDEARAQLDRLAHQAQSTRQVVARRLIEVTSQPSGMEPPKGTPITGIERMVEDG